MMFVVTVVVLGKTGRGQKRQRGGGNDKAFHGFSPCIGYDREITPFVVNLG